MTTAQIPRYDLERGPSPDTASARVASTPARRGKSVLLADRFFLIVHDDRTGRSRLHPRATELGLAAALLAELVLDERLALADGVVEVITPEPPADRLGALALRVIYGSPQHTELKTWLAFFAQDAVDSIGQRLAKAGLVDAGSRRTLHGRRSVFRARTADQRNAMAWEPMRLADQLCREPNLTVADIVQRRLMDLPDGILAALMDATGLTRHVLWDAVPHHVGLNRLPALVARLPEALRELTVATEAAVGAAITARR